MSRILQKTVTVIAAVALTAANISCSRFERVPKDMYRQLNSADADRWKIETTDGAVFAVTRFSVNDSTLVLEEFAREQDSATRGYQRMRVTPYPLDLDKIRSVEKSVGGRWGTGAGLVVLTLVVGIVLVIVFVINVTEWTVDSGQSK